MKKILAAILVTSCAAMTQAAATPITIEYKAVVGSLQEVYEDFQYALVQSTTIPGFKIFKGETVTGYLSYDTETPLRLMGDRELGFYYSLMGEFQQSLKFQNLPSPQTFNFNSSLGTDAFSTPFGIGTLGASDSLKTYQFNATFDHPGPVPAWAGHMPTADQWDEFGGNSYFDFSAHGASGKEWLFLRAQITSFRVVSAVPEPSAYLMLGAGLGMIALARRSRRTPPTVQA